MCSDLDQDLRRVGHVMYGSLRTDLGAATRRLLGLVVLATLLLLVSGCGSGEVSSGVGDPVSEQRQRDSQANDMLFECLADSGLAVTKGDDGAVQFVDPDDTQADKYSEAYDDCYQQVVDAGLVETLDDEAMRLEYRRALQLNDCLERNGFPVVDDFPSEDAYVERRDDFNLFALNTEEEWEAAESACPEEYDLLVGASG